MERFASAAKAGFQFVELMFPYDYNVREIEEQLNKNNLKLVLFNLPPGNWAEGERGIAVDAARKGDFRKGIVQAIEIAKQLGVEKINCLAGKKTAYESDEVVWQTLVNNVSFAADEFAKNNLKLLIEPINHFDMPGFYLNTTGQVIKLLQEINRSNAFLQYDIYHAEREGEKHSFILENYFTKIAHIQIADNPGRNQPGTGTAEIKYVLAELDRLGYEGYVSMEYKPVPDTLTSLNWLNEFGYRL